MRRSNIVRNLHLLQLLSLVLACVRPVLGFYISGWSPTVHTEGSKVELFYNKIFSERTQLPFAYADLPFSCAVDSPVTHQRHGLNLGELFRGDRIVNSGKAFEFKKDVQCEQLCEVASPLTAEQLEKLKEYIKQDYRVEWIVDDLPSATAIINLNQYEPGFHLGLYSESTGLAYVNNYFDIRIRYQKNPRDEKEAYILGFEVVPRSIDWKTAGGVCDPKPLGDVNYKQAVVGKDLGKISYSYSLRWIEDPNVSWSKRWEMYMDSSDPQIHWYSIINSTMLLTLLSIIVAFILLATLRKDIAMYNEENGVEAQDDISGWKLIHGDVFRAPRRLGLLTPLLGAGVQIFLSTALTLLFALFGVLNPSYRGGLVHYALFFYAFSGVYAGYHSTRIYKAFHGKNWRSNAFWTATVLPLFLFIGVCVLNTFNWVLHSSNALPAGTFIALIAMWCFIALPLVLLGSYFGNKKQTIEHPVRTNQIPRQIPEQSPYSKPSSSILIGGVVPFTVIFMELFFVFKSIWQDQYYYMFGFLALAAFILFVTCIEVTMVMIYFQLCAEDYRWIWKSFLISSSSTWYILGFGIYYYLYKSRTTDLEYMSAVYFFTYLVLGMGAYLVCTGMTGFFASYWFVRKIYGAVKID